MNSNAANYLAAALADILGPPEPGTIAFLRCLPTDAVLSLVSNSDFQIPRWQLFAVSGAANPAARIVTADQAVELREDKGPATLLLVDTQGAGAGMDGIYNAAKEIGERELVANAVTRAARDLPRGLAAIAESAVSKARKLGQRHTVSLWHEFVFYTQCASKPQNIGRWVTGLGLWPIEFSDEPDLRDIDRAKLMVERLLLPPASSKTPASRISALMLRDESVAPRNKLERVLRQAGGRALEDVLTEILAIPELWLNRLQPSFTTDKLARIELVPWRGNANKLSKWSGLRLPEGEALPHLILDRNDDDSGVTVRWNTHPDAITSGSVSYEVSIVAASDVLAVKTIEHNEKSPQKTFFGLEDFEELDGSAKFQAKIVIRAIDSPGVNEAVSEDFIIVFGTVDDHTAYHGSGETIRCAVDGAIALEERDDLAALCRLRDDTNHFRTDAKGFIVMRTGASRRSYRIFRPPLIADLEQQWKRRPEAIGRWMIQLRADGSRAGELQFIELNRETCPEAQWTRLVNASRLFCEDAMKGPGCLSRIYLYDDATERPVKEYLIAWEDALREGASTLSLAHTLEIQDVGGKTLGLIVLPSHPIRVAWQAAYDALAIHARFDCKMPPGKVRETLEALDSSNFPAMLPGLNGGPGFVFADTLGLVAVALVPETDREPKAAVSLMALCLGADSPELAPSVGRQTAGVLAREFGNYLKYHEHRRVLQVHALRPGDGATVVRALGLAIREPASARQEEASVDLKDLAFCLNLFPSHEQRAVSGRFLSKLAQRRRTGSGGIEKEDAWVLDPLACGGDRTVPRLRWARRDASVPSEPAHLSLAFDTFVSRIVAVERGLESAPLHAFGLIASLERRFSYAGDVPVWETWMSKDQDGVKHPAGRILTERLNRVHSAVLTAVARAIGVPTGWPVLRTELSRDEMENLKNLHRLSDWVVTVDRNAGVEYFDSPRDAAPVYETYVIDAVPERDDMGCLQLITSTMHLEEVRGLLDQALLFMGLSSSRRNCEFLLKELKSLSGRLAMRLASATTEAHAKTSGELVALALVRAHWPQRAVGRFVLALP